MDGFKRRSRGVADLRFKWASEGDSREEVIDAFIAAIVTACVEVYFDEVDRKTLISEGNIIRQKIREVLKDRLSVIQAKVNESN